MTAVLTETTRPVQVGDRVRVQGNGHGGWLVLIGTVFAADEYGLRVVADGTGECVNVTTASAQLLPASRATCPTCGAPIPGLLAGCTDLACVRAEIDADTALDARIEAAES